MVQQCAYVYSGDKRNILLSNKDYTFQPLYVLSQILASLLLQTLIQKYNNTPKNIGRAEPLRFHKRL